MQSVVESCVRRRAVKRPFNHISVEVEIKGSAHLGVGVLAGEVSKVTEDLALHVVFQGGEPAVGLLVNRVVQLEQLHQLLRLHLIGQRDVCFSKTEEG